MTTIHWATAEDQRLILSLHYDTGLVYGGSEPHGNVTGFQASVARRELLKQGLIRPTHGGGYVITPAGRTYVKQYRCT